MPPISTNHDLKIAHSVTLKYINEIAEKVSLPSTEIEHYGKYKAKIPIEYINDEKVKQSNLVLVTAITPTPAGEGKTTVSIGLSEGLNRLGKKSIVVLREPSLGPVFGVKGGATGGGYSQVVPMEDINLHFTGDFSAVERANNLLSALIDNSIHNRRGIDPRTVTWKKVMDMNDRSLRHVITGLGGKAGGFSRESGFNITAASEVMAILCLARDLNDLKEKMANIYIGDTFNGEAVFARDLRAHGSMAALLRDAIKPNLVQTLEGNPAIIHGGPFANIAQGTNSLIGTKLGMSLSDWVVTEAGFGADLGAEKFFNIKCSYGDISPKAVVLVATVRALKYHGGVGRDNLETPDLKALQSGLGNLDKHIENTQKFAIPFVVAINRFPSDTEEELNVVLNHCRENNVKIAISEGWEKGGEGALDLAEQVLDAASQCASRFVPTYDHRSSITDKIFTIANEIYGASNVEYSQEAALILNRIEELGLSELPVCIAKTQSSLSDNSSQIGRPDNFTIRVREIEIASGAGFIIPITGKMLRMPGLPKFPAAENIDIDQNGRIIGLS